MAQDPTKIASASQAAFDKLLTGLKKTESVSRGFNMAAAPPPAATTWGGLLKSGSIKGILKKPGGILGALFLAQFLVGNLLKRGGGAMREGLQQGAIEQQAGMSPEDAYYQAALPGLAQERQAAQDALMQAILAGRGQPMQVPGERQI